MRLAPQAGRGRIEKQTMKKTLLTTSIFLALACLLMLTACGPTEEDSKYDYLVTFDYNVASVGLDTDNYVNQYLGVASNSKIVAPGELTGDVASFFKDTTFTDYYVEGWYLGKTDGDGNVLTVMVYDSDGNALQDDDGNEVTYAELGNKWNFDTDTVTGNITLYANLVKKATLTVVVLPDTTANFSTSGVPGDTVDDLSGNRKIPKLDGYTFFGLYADEECTEEVQWPVTLKEGNQNIYAKYLSGTWQIASTASEFNSGITNKMNIYVTTDIDFSQTEFVAMQEYNKEINGNGHRLTGISFSATTTKNTYSGFGLFAKLGSSANIHDLTIENATFTLKEAYQKADLKVALLAYTIDPSATLTNVTVSGKVVCQGKSSDMTPYTVCTNDDFDPEAQATDCDFDNIVVEVTES